MNADPIPRLNAALEGRYRIERELGEGGMATVYLAEDLKHERNVALKVLKPELAAVVGAERFLAEIKTTANLQHPHILPLHDSGEADGLLFYVMPFVEGESLRARLDREHQLPVDDAVRIATNIAEALDYAHRHGVIHRDIKPANVLLQDGKPVISDFGIALAVGAAGGGRLTETGLSLGTPHYMSPEQATGDLHVGPPTDIWALGCVLYEMLVGEPPFTGGTPQAVLGKIITGESDAVSDHRRTVPQNVAAAVGLALEKVPADRFASAGDLARALSDPSFRRPGRRAAAQRPTQPAAWAGWGVAAALALLSAWSLARDDGTAGPPIRTAITLPNGVNLEGTSYSPVVAMLPDGSLVISTVEGGDFDLRRRVLDDLEPSILGEDLGVPFVSPNGAWIGGTDGPGRIVRVPADGGPVEILTDPPSQFGQRVLQAAWGDNDTIAFDLAGSFPIMKISSAGGEAVPMTSLDAARGDLDHQQPEMLPGGRALLFVIQSEAGSRIVAQSLDSGERHDLMAGTSPRYSRSGHLLFVREGSLWGIEFDPSRLRTSGDAVEILQGVRTSGDGRADFSVSPTGALAYVIPGTGGPGPHELVWVHRDGNEEPVRTVPGVYRQPRISPDGTRIAAGFGSPRDIAVLDLERGTRIQITFDMATDAYPIWSPDGRSIVFSSSRESPDGATRNLWTKPSDGTGEARRLSTSSDTQSPWGWSRDGRYLVFQEGAPMTGRWDIGLLEVERGGRGQPLIATDDAETNPAISPDGNWIAYDAGGTTGLPEIYVRPFPSLDGQWKVSVGGGFEPRWSPDGTELYYRTGDRYDAMKTLMAVPVQAGPLFQHGVPAELFGGAELFEPPYPSYDVHPDGRFLVVKRPRTEGSTPAQLIYLQNFTAELERRLKRR